jgi:hypothetical protein
MFTSAVLKISKNGDWEGMSEKEAESRNGFCYLLFCSSIFSHKHAFFLLLENMIELFLFKKKYSLFLKRHVS